MRAFVVAIALLAACHRGDHADAGAGSAVASVVPHVLFSEDGVAELAKLDRKIERSRWPTEKIGYVTTRANVRGRLEDYQLLDQLSAEFVKTADEGNIDTAWVDRTRALTAIHEFAAAREALEQVKKRSLDDSHWLDLDASIASAAGPRDRAFKYRADGAKLRPNAVSLTLYAASLALEGELDRAIALIPRANAALRDNQPETVAWLIFQWGRLYEQKGDLATARAFFAEAHARLPGYVEATAHLAQTLMLTGDAAGAKTVVKAAAGRHPSLLELAAQLGLGSVDDARAEWERYVKALPKAFADHAARFYLGVGKNPQRALELARLNLANRDVPEARELVIQAALAANDPASACDAATGLVTAPLRAHRFAAWQAFSRCGRTAEADDIAARLNISAH